MREEFVDRFCAALQETERTTPFGDDTVIWTVRGHMFAAYTTGGHGVSVRVENRLAAHKLVARGQVMKVRYLRDGSWVIFPWSTGPDKLRARITKSYDLVMADGNGA